MPLRLAPALPAQLSLNAAGEGGDLPGSAASLRVDLRSLPCSRHSNRTFRSPRRPSASAARPSSSHRSPGEGAVERRQAHSSLPSRLRGAISRACEARTVPLQPGRPLGAPPWRFSAGDPRRRLRQWHRSRPAICPLPGRKARRAGSRTSRAAVSRRQPRDATPRSACRIVSGDAPHERGYESLCSTNSLRSQ
jgi:hypothetical protein